MTVLDSLCLWLGRAWSVAALLLVAAVAAGVLLDRGRRRTDVRRTLLRAQLLAERNGPLPVAPVGCTCPECERVLRAVQSCIDYLEAEQAFGLPDAVKRAS